MTSPSHIQINTNVLKCIKAAVFMSACRAPDIYIQIHSSIWNHVPPLIVKNLVENHAWDTCNVQFSTVYTSLNKFSSSMLLTFVLIEDEAWRNFEVSENKTKQNRSCYQRTLARLKCSGSRSHLPWFSGQPSCLALSFSLLLPLPSPSPSPPRLSLLPFLPSFFLLVKQNHAKFFHLPFISFFVPSF